MNKIVHSKPTLKKDDFEYISHLLNENYISPNFLCQSLIDYSIKLTGKKQALITDSGTSAFQLILKLLKQKDKAKLKKYVVLSCYSCPSLFYTIIQEGLKPILIDTCEHSLNLNSDELNELDTSSILALLASNIGGIPDNFELMQKLNIPIISDCAQGIGSEINQKDLSSLGAYSIMSFGPTKMITGGLGGMVLCNDLSDFLILKNIATAEHDSEFYEKNIISEYCPQHPNELNSGLILSQLKKINYYINSRQDIANIYDNFLSQYKKVKIIRETEGVKFNRFRYYFFCDNANKVVYKLQQLNIDARKSISHTLYIYHKTTNKFVNCTRLNDKVVSLPIYPELTSLELDYIISSLNKIL